MAHLQMKTASQRCRRVLRASTLAPYAGKPAADHHLKFCH